MLISRTAMVRWNGYTRKYYEERGYIWTKQNSLFECKIEDLQLKSTAIVQVKCDYCGNIHEKKFHNFNKNKELVNRDCCNNKKCMLQKSKEVNLIKYGVENYKQTEKSRNKSSVEMRTSEEEILSFASAKGLTILNIKDYKSDRTRLFIICSEHADKGIQETNFANIKSAKHCCKYIKNRPSVRKLDGEVVFNAFEKAGLIPLFENKDYKNNSQPMPYKCPDHLDKGIQYRTYANLKYCNGCLYCGQERSNASKRNDQQAVFNDLINRGLIPIEDEIYISKDTPLYYRCEKHPNEIQHLYYGTVNKVITHCDYCRFENSLSSLNRILRSSIHEWRETAKASCENKCVLTGDEVYDIHHTYSFNSIIKDSLDILNLPVSDKYNGEEIAQIKKQVVELHRKYEGVCLRPDLHILFHQMYGKHNNTLEQFEEFKSNYTIVKLTS